MVPPKLEWLKSLGLHALYSAEQEENNFGDVDKFAVRDFIENLCQGEKGMDQDIVDYFTKSEKFLIAMDFWKGGPFDPDFHLNRLQLQLENKTTRAAKETELEHMIVIIGVLVTMYGYTESVKKMRKIPRVQNTYVSWVCV